MDIVDAKIRHRIPDLIIEDIIELQRSRNCMMWFFESVQFQEFMRTELMKRTASASIFLPATPILPHSDKILRIESLEPTVTQGLIRFRHEQTVLLEQLKHFPKADHDDGPDCLHMLYTNALKYCRPTDILLGNKLSSASVGYLKGFGYGRR